MKNIFLLTLISLIFTNCFNKKKVQIKPVVLVPFKTSSFNVDRDYQLMEKVNPNEDLTLYSSTNKEEAQEKTISSLNEHKIFLLDETNDLFFVEIANYGNNPKNIKGYLDKRLLKVAIPNYFEIINLSETLEEETNKDNVFTNFGSIKLIEENEYNKFKNNLYLPFFNPKPKPQIDENQNNYKLILNNGSSKLVKTELYEWVGFCSILQNYVFKNKISNEYELFNKKQTNKSNIRFNSIPVYNSLNDRLSEFYSINNKSVLNLMQINSDFTPILTKKWTFINFKVIENSSFWASKQSIVCKIESSLNDDITQAGYIMIQFTEIL